MINQNIKCLIIRSSELDSPTGEVFKKFKRDLKRTFKNESYLEGWIEAYGHGLVEIKSLEDIEEFSEKNYLHHYDLFFVEIKSENEEN